ncbi:unnamed protein product [Ixodes hexagonus]
MCFSSLSYVVKDFIFVGSIFRNVSLSRKSGGRKISRSRAIFILFISMDDLFFCDFYQIPKFSKIRSSRKVRCLQCFGLRTAHVVLSLIQTCGCKVQRNTGL